ncbi:ERF family protein [Clostridium sp. CX1]|uniref:ERF family protein n=1 Tax=Clostridium sp. CX1 TaxID=2978346 RepID=UPI0021C1C047|nr:ERF family protein [Clostridium sp. CX1]MCT8978281.1 ERF family protein [Clostridium sp. CX1]
METKEQKPMNIYQKRQECIVGLQKAKLKMTGKNTYSNYEYYELGDFLPELNKLMQQNHLAAVFKYTNEEATLTIIDTDKIEDQLTFSTPVELTQLKGCNGMQNIGGTQTFARRYLYIMAFEISEPDTLNNGEIDEEAEMRRKKIDLVKVKVIKDLIVKSNSDEAAFLKWAKVKRVEDITNGNFNICLEALDKALKKHEAENKANDIEGVI